METSTMTKKNCFFFLILGQMYKWLGGKKCFQIFAIASLITCFAHIILRPAKHCTHHLKHTQKSANNENTDKLRHDDICELEPLQKKTDNATIYSNA